MNDQTDRNRGTDRQIDRQKEGVQSDEKWAEKERGFARLFILKMIP